jgi:beta-xylosidase
LGVARAKKLLGPWEKNPSNPIVAANADWQCPGHGSIVSTPDGRDFLLYHSYRKRRDTFNVGREAVLDEIKWGADGWPTLNAGRGPSSIAPAPLGVAEGAGEQDFFDGFNVAQLGPEWQWPMTNDQSARVEVGGGGHLLLAPLYASGDELTGAVVARRTTSGDYVATASLDTRATAAGVRAGLAAYGWERHAVGVSVIVGQIVVWRREGKDERRLASADVPRSPVVYLRMTTEGGERYRFAYSANGREWTELGGAVDAGYIEGARVALLAGGGTASFDWVKIAKSDK